jgi:stress response protein SCP2
MDQLIDEVYLRRCHKMLPLDAARVEEDRTDAATVATFVANLESVGWIVDRPVVQNLIAADRSQAESLMTRVQQQVFEAVGAHVTFRPMYPNFPKQVMEASEAELFLNAILHYAGDLIGRRIIPLYPTLPRPPFPDHMWGQLPRRTVGLGSMEHFICVMKDLLASKTAFSPADLEDITVASGWDELVPSPEQIVNKENLASLIRVTYAKPDLGPLRSAISTPTDVLRIAVAFSNGDVSLAKPPAPDGWDDDDEPEEKTRRLRTLPRWLRRVLLAELNKMGDKVDELFIRPTWWKLLGEQLHPAEYRDRFPVAAAMFDQVRSAHKPATPGFGAKLEQGFSSEDLDTVLPLLMARPGVFVRNLDRVLRNFPNAVDRILESFNQVAAQSASTPLLQALAHFEERALEKPDSSTKPSRAPKARSNEKRLYNPQSFLDLYFADPQPWPNVIPGRVFFPKGNIARAFGVPGKAPELPPGAAEAAVTAIRQALETQFGSLEPLGRVFIDPQVYGLTVPFGQRSASRALRTLGRGSRILLPDANTIRLFMWWQDDGNRVDLDLSVIGLKADFSGAGTVAYNSLRGLPGSVHSGDLTSAPDGAAEFIDLDRERLVTSGIRYIAMIVTSFTQQPFDQLPGAFAGFMARPDGESGEIFDARTVQDRFDLAGSARMVMPLVLDLKLAQAVWLDMTVRPYQFRENSVAANRSTLAILTAALLSRRYPSLGELFALHARARGNLVRSPKNADVVISEDGTISPYDTEQILADFL